MPEHAKVTRRSRAKHDYDPTSWCPRCQEREASPPPHLNLENTRHETFCRNLVVEKMDIGAAYSAAGYKATKRIASEGGRRLKLMLIIANRVEYLLDRTLEKAIAGADFVGITLREIVDRCMQAKPHLSKDGKPDGQWVADHNNANKALYNIGLGLGMWRQKIELSTGDKETEGKSDAEVRAMLMSYFHDLGRPFFIQAAEEVFGLKLTDGGTGDVGSESPPVSPVSALH